MIVLFPRWDMLISWRVDIWNMTYSLPPKKTNMTSWKIHQWRCISDWTWGVGKCHVSFQRCIWYIVDRSSEAINCLFCTGECMWFSFFSNLKWYIIEIKQKADIIRLVAFVILPGLQFVEAGYASNVVAAATRTEAAGWSVNVIKFTHLKRKIIIFH